MREIPVADVRMVSATTYRRGPTDREGFGSNRHTRPARAGRSNRRGKDHAPCRTSSVPSLSVGALGSLTSRRARVATLGASDDSPRAVERRTVCRAHGFVIVWSLVESPSELFGSDRKEILAQGLGLIVPILFEQSVDCRSNLILIAQGDILPRLCEHHDQRERDAARHCHHHPPIRFRCPAKHGASNRRRP